MYSLVFLCILLCVNKVEIVDLCVDDVVDERLYEKIRDSVIFVLLY